MTEPTPNEYVPCPRHGTRCFPEIPDLARRIECAIGLGDGGANGVKATAERIMAMIEDHVLTERSVLAELRTAADILTEALNAENVEPQLASRVLNRFLSGDPRGLDAGPMPHPEASHDD